MTRTPVQDARKPGPRRVSKPQDRDEGEARRAADVVARGGSVAGWSFSSVAPSVQRQEADKPKTENEKYKEAAEVAGKAALKTPEGQALKKKVLDHPVVKPFTSPAVLLTAIGGGVGALAATGKELPIQPPEIPLDFIKPGLAGEVTWKGPVAAPTSVGLLLTFTAPLAPKGRSGGKPSKEAYRAETARLRAEQESFGRAPGAPGAKEAEERQLSEQAIDYVVSQQSGRFGLTIPLAEPAAEQKEEERTPVQPAPASPSAETPAQAHVDGALASPGRRLDAATRRSMESRFGHDFSRVRVHDDARASATADELHAAAFTVGEDIAFASGRYDPTGPEGGRLLAHELAHVVQQSRGPGIQGMVQRFSAYSPAEQAGGASNGWQHPGGTAIRIADDGNMAVEDKGWNPGTNKRAWTTPVLIGLANTILTGQGSRANLRAKPGGLSVAGTAPEAGNRQSILTEIEPFNPDGGTFDLASDCGRAARQVMGSGGGDDRTVLAGTEVRPANEGTTGAAIGGLVGLLGGGGLGAAIGFAAGGPLGAAIGAAVGGIAGLVGGIFAGREIGRREAAVVPRRLSAREYQGGDPNQPEQWSEELFKKEFGADLTRQEAYARYAALSDAERDAFDRRNGINKYASPQIGQSQTIVTEKDMPGYVPPVDGWNFHYAATVLRSGDDHMTLESAAGWDPEDWIFYLYGPPRKAQSFHEEHLAMGSHGSRASTYVVEPGRLND